MTSWIEVGEGDEARRIAVLARDGAEPPVVWFGGFRSDMRATKAEALDAWAAETGRSFVRFDYSGHGESGGSFADGTISRWLEEGLAVLGAYAPKRPVLVGSSMGAWIATLAAIRLAAECGDRGPAGLVLIAPAIDFTERLMWDAFPADIRHTIETDGVYYRPSLYSDEPYPITAKLILDGRRHLILDGPITTRAPIHILQGMRDPDVPWEHALSFVERLPGENVQLTLIKDGDHRLSRPEDLDRLVRAVEAVLRRETSGVS
ncbi:alpha/beta hydrolase [Enterovirga aerilata]|uniref:Palmitoyl-protein thioesterase ABHD10, mitochondrial n=1 Tax=Enterovirga aerilata TaxID=2730920 RepID=A0A849I4B7_9HYPH|nr:alpha/beta hydrolase [Enterovirga sp. DB1703]NNM70907.1 alpha/beta hydrolase [Enterovirga sp. DB1703]